MAAARGPRRRRGRGRDPGRSPAERRGRAATRVRHRTGTAGGGLAGRRPGGRAHRARRAVLGRCRARPGRSGRRGARRAGRPRWPGSRAGCSATSAGSTSPGWVPGRPAPLVTRLWPRPRTGSPALPGVVRRGGAGPLPRRPRQRGLASRPRAQVARRHRHRRAHPGRSPAVADAPAHRDAGPSPTSSPTPRPGAGQRRPAGDGRRQPAGLAHAVPKTRGPARSRISAQWRWTSRQGEPDRNPSYYAPRHYTS